MLQPSRGRCLAALLRSGSRLAAEPSAGGSHRRCGTSPFMCQLSYRIVTEVLACCSGIMISTFPPDRASWHLGKTISDRLMAMQVNRCKCASFSSHARMGRNARVRYAWQSIYACMRDNHVSAICMAVCPKCQMHSCLCSSDYLSALCFKSSRCP